MQILSRQYHSQGLVMRHLSRILAAAALTVGAYGAQAADLPSSKMAPIGPTFLAYNWTGFYVGIQGGYQWGNVDGTNCNVALTVCFPFSNDPDGFVVGGHVGYNFQFNQFVVGIEGDIEYSDMKGTVSFDPGLTRFHRVSGENWQGSLRARVGVAFDRLLVYATGGVAFADMGYDVGFIGAVPYHTISKTHTGWTLGGGVEYAFTQNVTGRVEYRYADYGSASGTNVTTNSVLSNDLQTHTVRVGLSYKF
jgi:outer membrane immunogenic protein